MITDQISDDELEAMALAADPETPVADDAVSLAELNGGPARGLLPEWYMAAPAGGLLSGWRRRVVLLVVVSLVTIMAAGLCNTYGQLEHLF